jgi:hypothetical protein
VQVFGRRDDGLTTRSGGRRPKSAKAHEIAGGLWRRCRGRYGDFAAGSGTLRWRVNRGQMLESICAENNDAFEKYFINQREYPMPQSKTTVLLKVVCARRHQSQRVSPNDRCR